MQLFASRGSPVRDGKFERVQVDRDTLTYLLRSGKFLCYDPIALERDSKGSDDDPGDGAERQFRPLFDSPHLTHTVFFKEAMRDKEDELYVTTRAMLVFNSDNATEGGASVNAEPDKLMDGLSKWFGGRADINLSFHDRNVLEALCRTPTFDPFFLLAQKREIERDRAVDPAYFELAPKTANAVREIIERRARELVMLALGPDAKMDRVDATIEALEEAIWRCETNNRTGRLFKSLGIPKKDVNRVLFAWKGIAYYEFIYMSFATEYADFLGWLRSEESLPKDAKTIDSRRAASIAARRRVAMGAMRSYYAHANEILDQHSSAYAALIKQGKPEPFQRFLMSAPSLFETLGLSIGAFGHANNAWRTLTNNGRRMRRKADALEPFFRFLASLAVPDTTS